jgi:hypothetical protein
VTLLKPCVIWRASSFMSPSSLRTAPHYLSVPEKVDLCSQAPPSKGQDPVRCLTAVAAAAKEFKNGPKKALGYFLESLWDAR